MFFSIVGCNGLQSFSGALLIFLFKQHCPSFGNRVELKTIRLYIRGNQIHQNRQSSGIEGKLNRFSSDLILSTTHAREKSSRIEGNSSIIHQVVLIEGNRTQWVVLLATTQARVQLSGIEGNQVHQMRCDSRHVRSPYPCLVGGVWARDYGACRAST